MDASKIFCNSVSAKAARIARFNLSFLINIPLLQIPSDVKLVLRSKSTASSALQDRRQQYSTYGLKQSTVFLTPWIDALVDDLSRMGSTYFQRCVFMHVPILFFHLRLTLSRSYLQIASH